MFDIIIAGAGPAGLSAAGELSKHPEINVLLLEKNKIGETKNTWAGFTEELTKRGLGKAIAKTVSKAGFSMLADKIDMRNFSFSTLNTKNFLHLLESKLKKNIQVLENCEFKSFERKSGKLIAKTSKGSFTCDMLIDASGFKSPVSRHYKLQEDIFVWQCYVYEIERTSPKNLDEVLWHLPFNAKHEVNFWSDVREGMKCDIGLMYLTKSNRLLPEKSLKKYLDKYMKLRGISGKKPRTKGGIIAMNSFERASFDNILMAGNSASQAAPDTGYGLIPALDNGKLAGKIAAEAVKKKNTSKDFLKKYDKILWETYGLNYRFNYILQSLHYYLEFDDVRKMVDSFKVSTKWMIKKTKSNLTPKEISWFFKQFSGKFNIFSLVKSLPHEAFLKILGEYTLFELELMKRKLIS